MNMVALALRESKGDGRMRMMENEEFNGPKKEDLMGNITFRYFPNTLTPCYTFVCNAEEEIRNAVFSQL